MEVTEKNKLQSVAAELKAKADNFDWYPIAQVVEKALGIETDYGWWQEYVCILPNFMEVTSLTKDITPIAKGKCWIVYDQADITDELVEKISLFYWCLDDIIKRDFISHGIEC